MENIDKIIELLKGDLNEDQTNQVLSEINKDSETKQTFNRLKIISALLATNKKMETYEIENSYNNLQNKLSTGRKTRFRFNSVMRYAAILIFLISISTTTFYLTKYFYHSPISSNLQSSFITEYGQTSKVILPDSSIVWLNSGTILSYGSDYNINNRNINLTGEAYFSVRRNEKVPFNVNFSEMHIEVLGTEFNVQAYADDHKISVVLEKGSLELSHDNQLFRDVILKPGQIAQFDPKQNNFILASAKTKNYTSWKDGILYFEKEPIRNIIKKLERKYNIEIQIDDPCIYDLVFTATIKDESIEDVFEMMKFAAGINYQITYSKDSITRTKIIMNN